MTDNEIANEYKMYTPEECLQKIVDQHKEINRLQARVEKCEKVEHFADKTIATLQAENERLRDYNQNLQAANTALSEEILEAKAEAYKEFAELVQGEIDDAIHSNYNAKEEERQSKKKKLGIPVSPVDNFFMYCDGKIHALSGINNYIDNLLKEMIGE